ncbi:Ubiquinone/menaquinone biosynthesis C-methylase UbiE [Flavobacterium resistens]|uniref:Methyltransferase domain-containing protein n=1 Tax=Flavobacterium resistens TaxID=443612 RepID=A0A521D8E1_9FLAO|nr:class I SAM-dependent methyltransferase [Flavobacterium resistens]MRX70386.1 methyltransferase domain-containing protein [Flavobacterium resistens]SMO67959.1 Ubiquinone/menaquinone biosynthesis C-methylase UbiE [Flavobacterium resistens]
MNYNNKSSQYFSNVRVEMLKYLPKDSSRILEVGCGRGCFGASLKKENNREVWGLELMPEEGKEAKKVLDRVLIGKCEDLLNDLPDNYFDAIYFNDVLEHLFDPYSLLKEIKRKLTDKGVVISSIPNIRYHNEFRSFLFKKDWKYEQKGVLDFTHMRFFTGKSIQKMYKDAGYVVNTHEGINKTKSLKPYFLNILFLFTQLDIFYVQYATVASKAQL